MRIAVFSDIHGNIAALDAVLEDIRDRHVDQLICLGDLVTFGPCPGAVIERLRALGCPVVQGNTDTWYQKPLPNGWQPASAREIMVYDCYRWLKDQLTNDQHAYLLGLPLQQRNGTLLSVHGSPRSFTEGMFPTTPEDELAAMVADIPHGIEVVLSGHTHHPLHRQLGHLTVVGAGSVGLPADGDPRPCYALLQQTAQGWQVQWPRPAYDIEVAIAAATENGLPHQQTIAHAWRSGLGLTG